MNKIACIALIAALAATSACKKVDSVKVSEAEATKASDEMLAAALSADIARIDGLYAKDVIAVDAVAADLANGADAMHTFNAGFAQLKFDKMAYTERHIQLLDGEDFIVTAKVHAESTDGPVKKADFRITDSWRKQTDGSFKVVNEHLSFPAAAPK